MRRALELARRGSGSVSPNPLVGCVIVKDGRVIGEGWHRSYGCGHAETEAIDASIEPVRGATLYCSLEPCSHEGGGKHQPPCVPRIIREGISRVVVANIDPNPRVDGRGVASLRQAGIEVETGVLAGEGAEMNEAFFKFMRTGIPFVTMKIAQSLDGRIAARGGRPEWITDAAARRRVHRMRARHDAVLVGRGTVSSDDPQLTVRLAAGRDPLRVILDSSLTLPLSARVLSPPNTAGTVVVTTPSACPRRAEALRARGVEVVAVRASEDGRVDLKAALEWLGGRGVTSVLVEGGAAVFTAFAARGLFDRLVVFVSPILLGKGVEAIGDLGATAVAGVPRLTRVRVERIGDQAVVTACRGKAPAEQEEEPACSRAS
jgi:diaminohydroxyphosphoribosylaminopyrimidine deaminase/5-amino-6-(5-phosphoribosylamino)uracil reductase